MNDEDSEIPQRAQSPEVVEPTTEDVSTTSGMSVAIHHREGPLPSPAELQAYFDISEGVGHTIVGMAKKAASHRHMMERRSVWVIIVLALCVTSVMLLVVAAAAWVAVEVSVLGGVIVLLASPSAVLWTLVSRMIRQLRRQRRDPEDE